MIFRICSKSCLKKVSLIP